MKTQTTIQFLLQRLRNGKLLIVCLLLNFASIHQVQSQILNASQTTSSGPYGTTHCISASVTNNGLSVPNATVVFTVTGANPQVFGGITDIAGIVLFCYQGINPGFDHIIVTYSTQLQTLNFLWTAPCTPTTTSDGDPCTNDFCDPNTGLVTHTPSGLIANATPHTPIQCYGGTTCIDVTATGGNPPYTGTGSYCGQSAGPFDVIVTDGAGCASNAHADVTEPLKLTTNPSAMPTPCGQNLGLVSANANGGTPGPKGYEWYDSNNALVGSASQVTPLPAGNYTVTVTDPNGCTATGSVTVGIVGTVPNDPGPITGPQGLCKGQMNATFCVPNDPNATSYEWHLPLGNSGSSTTNCITFNVSTSYHGGSICVKAKNACGESNYTCIYVPVINTKLPKPSPIVGPSPVCVNGDYNYCVNSIPLAEKYNWTITGNGGFGPLSIVSGQGTPCVVVHVPLGYNGGQTLKVNAENCMGKTADQSKAIKILAKPAQPGNISGPSSVCKTQIGTYLINPVNNATTYMWSITSNGAISGGQGTTSVAVDFIATNANSAVLSVTASNMCGTSLPRIKNISINPNCRIENNMDEQTDESSFTVYPNPAHKEINLDFVLQSDAKCRLQFVDYSGRLVKQEELQGISGQNHHIIDLEGLSTGVYLIVFDTPEKRNMMKVFVE